ncbi:MAG TPA: hypothetical protein VH298_00330 [Jatrophihabitans sp.]|jgi:hypothetical protein|nr:hypothetical protein [Jatrophihabitans sp.]
MTGQPPAVLVITGAAGAGKSTVGTALAEEPGLLVLDGDVLAVGAAAVAGGARDYTGFWRYLLAIAAEVHRNGLVPVFSCICLPDQVVAARPDGPVHFLALISGPATVRRRICDRSVAEPAVDLEFHASFDATLRGCSTVRPHTFTLLDTTEQRPAATIAAAREWARGVAG